MPLIQPSRSCLSLVTSLINVLHIIADLPYAAHGWTPVKLTDIAPGSMLSFELLLSHIFFQSAYFDYTQSPSIFQAAHGGASLPCCIRLSFEFQAPASFAHACRSSCSHASSPHFFLHSVKKPTELLGFVE